MLLRVFFVQCRIDILDVEIYVARVEVNRQLSDVTILETRALAHLAPEFDLKVRRFSRLVETCFCALTLEEMQEAMALFAAE